MSDGFFETCNLDRCELARAPIAQHHIYWLRCCGKGPCVGYGRAYVRIDNASRSEILATDATVLCHNPSLVSSKLFLQLMAECGKGRQSGQFVVDAPTNSIWKFNPCD
jgi:hypothetical protein